MHNSSSHLISSSLILPHSPLTTPPGGAALSRGTRVTCRLLADDPRQSTNADRQVADNAWLTLQNQGSRQVFEE